MTLNENKFYTNVNLFDDIVKYVKAAGKWPEDLLDYDLADQHEIPIWSIEFDPMFKLAPGNCEGYYLDLAIKGYIGQDEDKMMTVEVGTIKTLSTDDDSVREMAKLYGELLIAYDKVVDKHADDMTRRGYNIRFYADEKYYIGLCEVRSLDIAKDKVRKFFKDTPECTHAVIRDNLTRKEITMKSEDIRELERERIKECEEIIKREHIKLKGLLASWYVLDEIEFRGEKVYLLENEVYGDSVFPVIVDKDLKIIISAAPNGFQDLYDLPLEEESWKEEPEEER